MPPSSGGGNLVALSFQMAANANIMAVVIMFQLSEVLKVMKEAIFVSILVMIWMTVIMVIMVIITIKIHRWSLGLIFHQNAGSTVLVTILILTMIWMTVNIMVI